jgi:lycopene cyclase domain-containing protein
MDRSWTYLLILAFSLLYPLAQSFERRIYMHRKFIFIMPGILVAGSVYLIWDVLFTRAGIWGFHPNFNLHLHVAGLPLEEWLFFLVIPWCVVFTYEVLRYFVKRFYHPQLARNVALFLLLLFLTLIPFNLQRTYTVSTLSFTSLMLAAQLLQGTHRLWLSGFWLTYLVSMLPFMAVNGLLTALPVVWYNNAENLGLRIWTVPVDDFIYLMGLLLAVVNIYQLLLHRYAPARLRKDMDLDTATGF